MPPERAAWLVLLPLAATALYYFLPDRLRQNSWMVFAPQIAAYGMLAIWLLPNRARGRRLFLEPSRLFEGMYRGMLIGLVMGTLNLTLLIVVIPGLGGDLSFLPTTPHAQAPPWLMFPWGIAAIGILVELNFRGFQLGRILALGGNSLAAQAIAVIVSALAFAWDPFMVQVFRSLHWMAFMDGLVWGTLLLRTRSLYATMAAHTVEVWILYAGLKLWLQ
ncbi:MAG TPA: CPBP family glutamic-type intramembrane protease [Nitrospirales bacterium]